VPGQETLRSFLGGLLAVEHDVVQQRWDCMKLMLRCPEVARGPDNPSPSFGHAGRVVGRGHAVCTSRPSETMVAGSEARTWTRLSKKLREHTRTSAGPAQHLISQPAAVPLCGGIVWDNDHEVVVAIWPTLTAGQGAEQVDALRLIRLDEAPDNFGKHWILPDGGRIHEQSPHLPSFGVVYQVFQ